MISNKMVDWILYNLPLLKTLIDDIEPSMSASVVLVPVQKNSHYDSAVEKIAIKKATLSFVVDAVKEGIRTLHPEQRKIYRMKYRAGMSYKQIECRLYMSNKTVERRVKEIRNEIRGRLEALPPSYLKEFTHFFDQVL
ncbi:sigma factor-like helix-turn-helix DNA-binding protein [Mahella australiensis]|uniref:Sigma-70 region 4 type 2 n=1 Tax=Mahella australiensis (strain DSM 15567 / CIP 107919 / 50-1 BON) TaxID=697281 RepID=F4A0W3_MAHA5|nr:sigma factor-like helix-turn-helix DNA-binding protein [Mahella australiensis]AEE98040.1 Sigma-70 region 4 type 2 [Mahella australiensis 50-1 BON]